jgi:hypothetical protein
VAGKKKRGKWEKEGGGEKDVLPTSLAWLLKNIAVNTNDKSVLNTRKTGNPILRNPTDKSVS